MRPDYPKSPLIDRGGKPPAARRLIILLLACLILFGGVFGMKWFGNKMMVQYLENMPVPPATISAGKVQSMTWDNRLEAIGGFVPVNGTDVTTESGGIVTAIHFESGAQVAKGAPLITLDSANEAADLKRLEAQANLAELNRERREKLFELEAVSKSDYDAAVSEAAAAKAAVDAQRARLAQKNIRAPFAGMIGIRRVNLGQYLEPGAPIVTIQSLDPIDFDFSLPEQYTGRVMPGYKVSIEVDAQPGRVFEGEVLAVEPRVDTATRNFNVRARLPNAEGTLRAGQFGRAVLLLPGAREVLVIPRTALNHSSYGTSVFVIQPRKAPEGGEADEAKAADTQAKDAPPQPTLEVVQRFIRVGDSRGDYVVVLEGLKAGEEVATSGLMKLANQTPVTINNSIAPDVKLEPNPPQT
jgi:membrane fusion protein (multidrug efflux system)